MKQYNNGQRKGMMYGGMSRRKPMMYGGTATKPRKKAQMGGMMSAPKQTKPEDYAGIQPAMGMPQMMSMGGKTHEQQESAAIERMEKKSKSYRD